MSRKSSRPVKPPLIRVHPRKLARSMAKAMIEDRHDLSKMDWRAAAVDMAQNIQNKKGAKKK